MNLESLMNKDEVRRLQKAARDGNKNKLLEWGINFEKYLSESYRRIYDETYQEEMQQNINCFMVAIAYTLYNTEELKTTVDQRKELLVDLLATIDLYRTGEMKPEDFIEDLKKDGIYLDSFDYYSIYKSTLDEMNKSKKEFDEKKQEYEKLIADINKNTLGSNQVKK